MEQVGVDELTRGTRCAKDLVGRDNSGFTVKGLRDWTSGAWMWSSKLQLLSTSTTGYKKNAS